MKHESFNHEAYSPKEDIIFTLDFEHDLSIDVISVDKCVFADSESKDRGFEGRIYHRDGSGDYAYMGLHWKRLPTKKDLMEFDYSDWIEEEIDKMECEQ